MTQNLNKRPITLNWMNYRFIQVDGYGLFGLNFIRALVRAGVNVHPCLVTQADLPGWMHRLMGLDWSKLTISLMPSYELRGLAGRQWNYAMYEGTGLEERWIPPLNRLAERLLVPHEWLVEVFKDHGCRRPIHVVPGGVDGEQFPVTLSSPYESGQPYTFLALGDRGVRKGWGDVWNAFGREFGDSKDVRLIVKGREDSIKHFSSALFKQDVTFWREETPDMNAVYEHADAFVFPSKGEGWGLPPREFALTGKPVICTRWSALNDSLDEWALPLDDFKMVSCSLPGGGEWARPSVEEIMARMRWCYEHREEARQKGLQAAAWLRANRSWDQAAQVLTDLIQEWR